MRTIVEQTKTNPVLADKAIAKVNSDLKKSLWWLDQSLGRAYKVTNVINGKKVTEPCVYTGRGNNYETLIPSSDLGNYCFWVLRDPTSYDTQNEIRIPYSLIFWMDLRNCYSGTDSDCRRDTENIKSDILSCLNKRAWIVDGAISATKVYEEAKNVWSGFSVDETTNQFMMQPYASMRFDGEIVLAAACAI